MGDPFRHRALQLLARGHRLYGATPVEPPAIPVDAGGPAGWPNGPETARARRLSERRRRSRAADSELGGLLTAAHAEHRYGQDRTRAVWHDARADPMPAADTPMGRREAVRRMAQRLHAQRRAVHRSRRHAAALARRMRRLGYPRNARHVAKLSVQQPISIDSVRYRKTTNAGTLTRRIAAALDRLGVDDPRARRAWIDGYQTLIVRESGGHPGAVASVPATAPGPIQSDGHGLGYARGLTQTIPTTFAHYHQPGTSTNIYDPVANICASINYVRARYGVAADGSNLAELVQQADPRRPPKGY